MTLIATHSGVRGLPGVELTGDVVERTVGGLVELLRERGLPAAVGLARDARPAGEALAEDVAEVLLRRGAHVVDFGVVSTPAAKLAARSRRLGGAVIVTGSHLDPELNGLKLVAGPIFGPVDPTELPEAPTRTAGGKRGELRRDAGAAYEHVSAICAAVDVRPLRASDLSLTVEGGAGPAGELLLEAVGSRLPADHPDAGVRLDADGDRLELVDEQGMALDTELILPLALLALDAKAVVKGADTSRIVDALATMHGAAVHIVPPGEIHLVEAMTTLGGDLAGEGNGGVIVPAVGLARDGLAAAAAILSLLARRGTTLSTLAAELPRYSRRRSTVPCTDRALARRALEALARRVGSEPRDPHDGVHVELGHGAWGLVRLSATEPVFRVTTEASTEAEAEGLHAELRAALPDRDAPLL